MLVSRDRDVAGSSPATGIFIIIFFNIEIFISKNDYMIIRKGESRYLEEYFF